MRKHKLFFIISIVILITIFSYNNVYADPMIHDDEWIKAYYTNVEIIVDTSHWELDENLLNEYSISENNIIGIHSEEGTSFIEDIEPFITAYFPEIEWINDLGNYRWDEVLKANSHTITIIYEREFKCKDYDLSLIDIEPPSCISESESVKYSNFYFEVEVEPGVIESFTPEQLCKWVIKIEKLPITHGEIIMEKAPPYLFTKWHKLNDGTTSAGMDISIGFTSGFSTEGFHTINRIKSQMVVVRYQEMGEEIYDICDIPGYPGVQLIGIPRIYNRIEFEHAGNEESYIEIEFRTSEGNYGEFIAMPTQVNGYFSINISEVPEGVTPVNEIFKTSPAEIETMLLPDGRELKCQTGIFIF